MALFSVFKFTIISIAGLYILLCFFVYFFADKIAYPAPKSSYQINGLKNLHFIKTKSDKKICTIFLKSNKSKNLIIYSHGNGEDIGEIYQRLKKINSLGFNVIAYDYYGYGLSEGKMSAKFVPEIADAVWDFAISKNFDAENITIMGYSMGSAPSCYLAANKNPKALIISSGFASAFQTIFPKNPLPWNMLNNASFVKQTKCPILIFHGKKDRIVPYWNAKILYKASNEPKFFVSVKDAGHYSVIKILDEKYFDFVKEFATKASLESKNMNF